ncbi:MAG: 50S ribosomal protein L32 [Chloroflexi bacterium]|nr:MAG: 50S ribosomal protein L32 [Chloroflexota bacterium]TMC33990.1 MAG: 50S ribosomal protein L32 [Chloroflexota bacterium]TME36855.1 MAG: 50S ribosomal protein L32 [Chloroflexota bacterium]
MRRIRIRDRSSAIASSCPDVAALMLSHRACRSCQ